VNSARRISTISTPNATTKMYFTVGMMISIGSPHLYERVQPAPAAAAGQAAQPPEIVAQNEREKIV
jgi:hypothetical protein